MFRRTLLIFLFFVFFHHKIFPQNNLIINEFLASNLNIIYDEYDEYYPNIHRGYGRKKKKPKLIEHLDKKKKSTKWPKEDTFEDDDDIEDLDDLGPNYSKDAEDWREEDVNV